MIPSTLSSSFAARIFASSSSRSTFRSSNLKPLNHRCQTTSEEQSEPNKLLNTGGTDMYSHFSPQVRSVHSAYLRAAGSVFARKPTSNGILPSLESPSDTSINKSFATVPANTTFQDVSSAFLFGAITKN